jgi:hypothetical protein
MQKVIYSTSFIEFLKNSDCKIANVLYRLNFKRYTPLCINANYVDYITFRKDGTISYLPSGKECIYNDSGEWSKEGRQNGKPSKVIKKLFSAKFASYFKDADFECFTNAYKANFNDDGYSFELLPSTKIPYVYDMKRAEGSASLNSSCMNGDSRYLDIYRDCKSLQILTLKNNEGELCGRSLLWKLEGDINLLDRIYVAQDWQYDKFLTFAKDNGYWRKVEYKSFDYKTNFVNPEGEQVVRKFIVHTDTEHDYYPYIDTFQYGGDGFLCNYSGDGIYCYNDTGGSREGDETRSYDEINDCYIDSEDAIYIEEGERRYRGRYCHIDNCVNVNSEWYHEDDENIARVNGNWYTIEGGEIVLVNDEWQLHDDCYFCERDGEYYLTEDCVFCEDDDEYILQSDAVKVEGNYYHPDSDKIVFIDGEYCIKNDDTDEETN